MQFTNTIHDPIEIEETGDSLECDKESGHEYVAMEENSGISGPEEESHHPEKIAMTIG